MANVAEEKAECERIFKRFDANGDGKISLTEFTDALNALGSTSQEEVQRRMKEIDKDGDGFISLQELMEFQHANAKLMKEVAKKL
ncbi:Calcium binding protein [Quillaja saponaria]|uniref:Calcium binding protein n=1 Tax=Quillaja saponaria TaxID=32244 RepID=A0AAD7M3H0_QUISA|nr:Calcium binding protein [Quillaja saponaria]